MSTAFDTLVSIMDRLRGPGGCPWDREQTVQTVASYLIEEAYEVVDAVRSGEHDKLGEELGDLLLQVVFMARIAAENGWFDMDAVCEGISEKMIRRHPHVFADRQVADSAEVLRNWEDIKKEERGSEPERSALDGIPGALPALLKAYRMTQKAAALGFDWQRPADVVAKLREEVEELDAELGSEEGEATERVRRELGDVLFAFANLARHLEVEPEAALQDANGKFMRRFQAIERRLRERGQSMRQLTIEELDRLWDAVKAEETE
jgi:tetrapyrrole methylase family protein/MazG family protein